ncbi:redoxin domain-containing protein [Ekhidna sp.]|uniref:redoxin domain-containing protein n=1 Tax=Ekhidna sp. TaxID=2608089 RepID=UPI0032EB74DC
MDRFILKEGEPIPSINAFDIFDNELDLESLKGKKLLIAFFRHVGCPFCNIRAHTLQMAYPHLKKRGMEMIFFFESTKEVLLANHFYENMSPVPIISDPDREWYQKYGVESSRSKSIKSHIVFLIQTTLVAKFKKLPVHWMAGEESFNTIPAEFLVDERGILRKANYWNNLKDRISMDAIMSFIKR